MGHRRRIFTLMLSCATAIAAGAGMAGTADATITDPPGYFHLLANEPGTCVDAQYANPGTQVLMWRCLNTEFEEWRRVDVPVPGNVYAYCGCTKAATFVNQAMGLCLAVASDTPGSGTPVTQESCNASDRRQWWLLPPGHVGGVGGTLGGGAPIKTFINQAQGLDVDQGRTDPAGVPLQVWTYYVTNNQLWGAPAGSGNG